jgi:hypothetical protein
VNRNSHRVSHRAMDDEGHGNDLPLETEMKINWRNILIAVLVIVVLVNWREIKEAFAELRLGEFWRDFTQSLQALPPILKFAVVLAVLTAIGINLRRRFSSNNHKENK